MSLVTAELQISEVLPIRALRNADICFSAGDVAKVYREGNRENIRPFPVSTVAGKEIFLLRDDLEKNFGLHQSFLIDTYGKTIKEDAQRDELREIMFQFSSQLVQKENSPFFSKILKLPDPRTKLQESKEIVSERAQRFITPRKMENRGERRNTRHRQSHDWWSPSMTPESVFSDSKRGFVIHGSRKMDNNKLLQTRTAVKHTSTQLQVVLAACFGFSFWSRDFSQAYLQSASKLVPDFYLKLGNDFNIEGRNLFKLLRTLYGLSDSDNG